MSTIPTNIDALDGKTPPSSSDPDNFRARGDAFLGAFPLLQDQINDIADVTYDNATDAYDSAVLAANQVLAAIHQVSLAEAQVGLAEDQVALAANYASDAEDYATMAASTANFVGNWNDQTGAASAPYSVSHNNQIWLLLEDVADITASEPSDANPAWMPLLVDAVPLGVSFGVGNTLQSVSSSYVQHNETIFVDPAIYANLASVLPATYPAHVATLVSDNPESGGGFARSVAVSPSYIAVGAVGEDADSKSAAGRVYIFDTADGSLLQTLESPNTTINGAFGWSVAITDNYLAVGAYNTEGGGDGRVYVYTQFGGSFGTPQTIDTPNSSEAGSFGYSVSITDNYLAVGAEREDGDSTSESGRAYVYTNSGGTYGSVQTIESPNAEASGRFGGKVVITDNYLAVSARQEDGSAISNSGRAYVYTNSGGTYGSVQTFVSPNATANNYYGESLSLTDSYLVVGAPSESPTGAASGRVYVYTNSGGTYGSVQTFVSPNAETAGRFGISVAVTDDYLIVGAQGEDAPSDGEGRAYYYAIDSGVFSSPLALESLNPETAGTFGSSCAADGDYFVIGAGTEDAGAANSGRAYLHDGVNLKIKIEPITGAVNTLTRIS